MTENLSSFVQNPAPIPPVEPNSVKIPPTPPTSPLPRWVIALMAVVVISSVVAFFLKILTPEPTVVPKTSFITENKDGSSTKFSQIVFKGTPPDPIESLPIVSVSESSLSLSVVREDLLKTYDLVRVSGSENTWSGKKYSFYYDELQDNYVLGANFDPPEGVYLASVPSAISAAEQFVATTFPGISVVPRKNLVTYFSGTRHVEEVPSPSKANFVVIPFSYVVEGVPVYLEHRETEAFTITMNAKNEVQRIIFQPFFVTITPIEKVDLIPFDQVLININNSQASIVSAYEKSIGIFTLDEIVSGELSEVSLEYRLDLENAIGYPFYRFKGNLINAEGKTINAEIITPAVLVK